MCVSAGVGEVVSNFEANNINSGVNKE